MDVYVYGMSYTHPEITASMYNELRPENQEGMLFSWPMEALHCPLNVERLAAAGFDYIAMGHLHTLQVLLS